MVHSSYSFHLGILAVLLIIGLSPSQSSAEIDQWTDSTGNVIYSDTPPAGGAAKEIKVKENNRTIMEETYPKTKKSREKESGLKDIRDISVILYMTDWCPYCKKARNYLSSAGVSFSEYDIEKDKQRRSEMMKKTGSTSVPVIDIEGTVIRGFVPAAIDAAILRKKQSE